MARWMELLKAIWMLCIGWMPPMLAVICTIAIIVMLVILVVKLIGLIMDAIPFL